MGSDMAGMALTQHRDKGSSIRAKTLPALWPRRSTTKERNEVKRSQGLWVRVALRIPGNTWFPTVVSGRSKAHVDETGDTGYLTRVCSSVHGNFLTWLHSHTGDRSVLRRREEGCCF